MEFTHSTREACKELRISDRTLLRLRRDGVLRPGDHYRAAGAGAAPPHPALECPRSGKGPGAPQPQGADRPAPGCSSLL